MKEFYKYSMLILLFLLLLGGFGILFQRMRWLQWCKQLLLRTKEGVEDATRRRLLEDRQRLITMQREHTIWYRLEKELYYSGLKRHFPNMTAETWMLINLIILASLFGMMVALGVGLGYIGMVLLLVIAGEYLLLHLCKMREMHSVNENLLKFLNFLGNYSITAGEVTGIFNQISKYVDEPLSSVLDECCYEAQTTGDCSMALLGMSEKIEHPVFKELIQNMEVSARYCADFTALVVSSRRYVREHLRLGEERKGMLREAFINMLMLLGMSLFAFIAVDMLIDRSIWDILWNTLPGRGALTIAGTIMLLLLGQLSKINQ